MDADFLPVHIASVPTMSLSVTQLLFVFITALICALTASSSFFFLFQCGCHKVGRKINEGMCNRARGWWGWMIIVLPLASYSLVSWCHHPETHNPGPARLVVPHKNHSLVTHHSLTTQSVYHTTVSAATQLTRKQTYTPRMDDRRA